MKSTRIMKAGILHKAGDISCESIPVPEIDSGEVLVAVKAVGICGSDILRFLRGVSPYDFRILGHECAGEVIEVGRDVSFIEVKDRVAIVPVISCGECDFCRSGEYSLCDNFIRMGTRIDGCFAEYIRVSAENLLQLPDTVDYESASILEPSAIALHSIKRASILPGDLVAVLGCGPIGLLIAQWVRLLGARRVFTIDIAEEKLEIARKMGMTDCINAKGEDPVKSVMRVTESRGVDLVFDSAGSGMTFEQSMRMARKLGKVVIVGMVGEDVNLPRETVLTILRHELTIYGVYDTDTKPIPLNSWQTSLSFIEAQRLDVGSLITHRFKIEDIAAVFKNITEQRERFNKVVFVF